VKTMRFIVLLLLCALLPAARAEESVPAARSLTMRQCIELALDANLDMQIERINPDIQRWRIAREQGAFDPALIGGVRYEENSSPLGYDEERLDANGGVRGRLPTGTEYGLTAFDTRSSSSLTTNFLFTGGAAISLTQPLLKNFGLGVNTAAIRIARRNRDTATEQFRQQVINTVSDVNNAYYELVFAREDYKSKIEDLHRAQLLLEDNRKRVRIGVLSPLDVTQAEAGVAEREEAVIVAERVIQDNENTLKRLITQDIAPWLGVTIIPLDEPATTAIATDTSESIRTAFANRPDYRQAKHEVERRQILVKYNRNQLWPEVDLQGSYGWNGRGNTFGNFSDNLSSGDYPVWAVGVTVTVPLGNRQARADYHTARLQSDQSLLTLKRTEQDIIVAVDNAVRLVQSNAKRLAATRAATRLAEESLRAENEKLRAGTSTSFLVLQAQAQLAAARSAEIRARADYGKSIIALGRTEGTTLEKHAIVLAAD